jgi:hypothetical protein
MLFFKTDQTSQDAESKMQFQIRAQMYHNLMVAAYIVSAIMYAALNWIGSLLFNYMK